MLRSGILKRERGSGRLSFVAETGNFRELALQVLELSSSELSRACKTITRQFEHAVRTILNSTGRVVFTGVGKSGHIGQLLASTFASLGTPSFFLHAGEGLHGDLGSVQPGDVVIAISNSGETTEILQLLPSLKRIGAEVISIVGRKNSTLANNSKVVITYSVEREACRLNLAPTTSALVTLAIGQALAVALQSARQFDEKSFAVYHPGGTLGARLLTTVDDIMHRIRRGKVESLDGWVELLVPPDMTLKDAIVTMTTARLGVIGVAEKKSSDKLVGVFTDGDLRRTVQRNFALDTPILDVATKNPKTILTGSMATTAASRMRQHKITSLFVVKEEKTPPTVIGILHIHDLLELGIIDEAS